MAISALITTAAAATAGAVSSYKQGKKALKLQEKAQVQAAKQAAITDKRAEIATNRANAKTPNVAAMIGAAQQASQGGAAGTMLTGPGGVNPKDLLLGKTSLLGS